MRLWVNIHIIILLICTSVSAIAASETISRIEIEGLNRVEKESVIAVLTSREGSEYSFVKIKEDIKSIYKLGFFKDIQIDVATTSDGYVITYMVEEKPSIKEVKLDGNDEIDDDDIEEVIDIKPYSVLNFDKIYKNIAKIKNVYVEKGFFLADVDYELIPEANNQVTVVFKMRERAKIQVKKVILMGNEKVSDKDLKSIMMSKPGNFLSFISNEGQFRHEIVERDAFMISNYYANHGYINAKIAKPQISISPDRKWVYISIGITEGKQYNMGDMEFSGDLLFPDRKFRERISLKKDEVFDRSKFMRDLERVAALYKDLGYAYANVTPLSHPDNENLLVNVNMQIQKGNKVRIDRVNIVGNTKTRDEVVRREMRIAEGDLYSITGVAKSKRKIYQLGYFETVEITEEPGADNEKIVLNIEVKERRTGTFQLGFGFSSLDSFVFQAQVNQANLFGRGQSLSLQAQLSGRRRMFTLHFNEPYLADTKINFGFSLYNQSISYPRQGEFGSYSRSNFGMDLSLGYPFWEDISLFIIYSIQSVSMETDNITNLHLFKSGRTSSITLMGQYDTRNNRLFPTDGMIHKISMEYADSYTGSEIEFMKFIMNSKFFFPVWWKLVFKINAEIGYVLSLEEPFADEVGDKDFPGVPIAERFLLGGIYTIRGFEFGSISPSMEVMMLDDPAGYPRKYLIGGNKKFYANFELEFPIIEAAGIRWVFFYDIGNTWSEEQQFFYLGQSDQDPYDLPLGMYMSWGFGFRWYSPIGPLRFEWGLPITRRPIDDVIAFEFSIGNQF